MKLDTIHVTSLPSNDNAIGILIFDYMYSRHSIIGALPFRARIAPIWESAPIIECLLYISNTSENKNNIKGAPFEEVPRLESAPIIECLLYHKTLPESIRVFL